MKYRPLGDSQISVSEIAFGSWLTFSSGAQKDAAIACVHRALDRGITLIDTANVYGRGAAEQVLGEALAGIRRDSYVLATKLYFPMSSTDRGLSRAQIFKQLDASLARLRVSHVDLYQCHRYDADTPLEETMQALSEVVKAGKVRCIGFSEWPVDRVQAALAIAPVKFVSSQPQYSLLHRDPERALIPMSIRCGISQIVWSPLAQGVLTRKYLPRAALPQGSRAADAAINGFIKPEWLQPKVLEAVQGCGRLRLKQASRPRNSRSPGYCGSPMSHRRLRAPHAPNKSTRTQPRRDTPWGRTCSARPNGSWKTPSPVNGPRGDCGLANICARLGRPDGTVSRTKMPMHRRCGARASMPRPRGRAYLEASLFEFCTCFLASPNLA